MMLQVFMQAASSTRNLGQHGNACVNVFAAMPTPAHGPHCMLTAGTPARCSLHAHASGPALLSYNELSRVDNVRLS
jgi:hypothetical protein